MHRFQTEQAGPVTRGATARTRDSDSRVKKIYDSELRFQLRPLKNLDAETPTPTLDLNSDSNSETWCMVVFQRMRTEKLLMLKIKDFNLSEIS